MLGTICNYFIALLYQTSERKSLAQEWYKIVLKDSISCRDCILTGHSCHGDCT